MLMRPSFPVYLDSTAKGKTGDVHHGLHITHLVRIRTREASQASSKFYNGTYPVKIGDYRQFTTHLPSWMPVETLMSQLTETEQSVLDPALGEAAQLRTIADVNVAAGLPYLHLTVRSENLHPGESKQIRSTEAVESLFERTDQFFRYAVDTLRAAPVLMADYAQQHRQPGGT